MGPYRTDLTAVLPAAGPEKNLLGKQSKASHRILSCTRPGWTPSSRMAQGVIISCPAGRALSALWQLMGRNCGPRVGRRNGSHCGAVTQQLFGAVLGIDRLHQLGWGVEL